MKTLPIAFCAMLMSLGTCPVNPSLENSISS